MANPEKEFNKVLKEFDESDIHKGIEKGQNKLKKIERRNWKIKKDLVLGLVEKANELFFKAYYLMGSTMAVDSFMDETKRNVVIGVLKKDVRAGLGAIRIGLIVDEKHFQHEPALANVINNTKVLTSNFLKFINTYIEKLERGWNGGTAKDMIREVEGKYKEHLGYIEKTLWRDLPELRSASEKAKKQTEAKLGESARRAA